MCIFIAGLRWAPICLCLPLIVAGQAVLAFEFQKEKRYLVTTHIGECLIGEFMEQTDEFVFINNFYSITSLRIDNSHIRTTELLDLSKEIPAPTMELQPQLSVAADLGMPLGEAAAFLKTGYVTRADLHFVLPLSFLQNSPFEWRFGVSAGYGSFNAQGNTFIGRLNVIPLIGYVRLRYDKMRFFLKPYATFGSGVTFTSMTKNITASGVNSSESSPDLTLMGSLGVEAMLGRHVALFSEISSYALFEGMNGMFLKFNFGTGYKI